MTRCRKLFLFVWLSTCLVFILELMGMISEAAAAAAILDSMKLYKFILMQNLLRFSAQSFHFPVNCTSRLITLLRQVDEKYVFKLHALELINIDIKQNGRNLQNI